MKEGAEAKAKELGVDFRSFAGKYDGDNTGQVDAIERLMSAGAKAILITPSDTKAIVPSVERARKAGILVIALDTPLDPPSAADATFATDNLKAGELIGEWAAKTLGDKAKDARVAYIDALVDQPSVDRMRDFGFSKGFGVENSNWKQYGHETDKRVVGHQWGQGAEAGGRAAMETLLQKDPNINVVYTINEPTAAGAYAALKAAGKDKGAAHRLGRRRMPRRQERGRRHHRRDRPAISAADGLQGRRGGCRIRQDRQEAAAEPRSRFLQYRRLARHRQAGRRRSVDLVEGRPRKVLGLRSPANP